MQMLIAEDSRRVLLDVVETACENQGRCRMNESERIDDENAEKTEREIDSLPK
jgi:hypothetical protein